VDSRFARPLPVLRVAIALAIAAFALVAALALRPSASTAAAVITGDFSWSPSAPIAGDTVTFTASVLPSDGATITEYRWAITGSGKYQSGGDSISHTYPAATNIRVRLQVKDSAGQSKTFAKQLSVSGPGGGGQAPVASFTYAPTAPVANQPVLFTSTSTDPDGTITNQLWDLNGDGNFDNGGGTTALRTFSAPGEYVVGLRVTDNDGLASFDSETLTVLPEPGAPVAVQKTGFRLLSPFPVVRIAGRITPKGTRVRLLRVDAPKDAKVSVSCSGKGCPFKKQVRTVSATPKNASAAIVRVRRLERLIRAGVRVRVYVTKAAQIGKYTRFRFRAGKPPVRTDGCLMPGAWTPSQCPAG
jgi:plastocyanin